MTFSGKAIESLATCRPQGLSHLSIAKCNQVPIDSLVTIITHNGPSLLSLDLSYFLAVDNSILTIIGNNCPNLSDILLDGCFKISSHGLVALKVCREFLFS
jgi:hypothetical protein